MIILLGKKKGARYPDDRARAGGLHEPVESATLERDFYF